MRPTPFEDVEELKAGFIVWAVRLCETGHFPMLARLNYLLNGSDLECGCTQCDWNLAVQIVALLPLLFLFFPLVFLLLNHLSLWDVRCLCFSQHGLNVRAPGFWNIFRGFCPFRRVGMPSFFQQMPILGKPYLPQASPAIGPRTTRRPRTRTRIRTETWLFTSMPSHTSLRPLPPTTPASIRAAFRTVTGYLPTCARARKPTMARFNHRSRIVHDAGRSKPKWIFAGSPTYRPWEPCLQEHSDSPPLVSWFIVSFIMTCL